MLTLKDSKPGFPLLLHDEPILNEGIIIGRTTSGNYSFIYKKNMAFGYINSNLELNSFTGKSLEIEVEKSKYESNIETQPLHDSENKLLKG